MSSGVGRRGFRPREDRRNRAGCLNDVRRPFSVCTFAGSPSETHDVSGSPHERRITYNLARARTDGLRAEFHQVLRERELSCPMGDSMTTTSAFARLIERLIEAERLESEALEDLGEPCAPMTEMARPVPRM